MEKKFLESLKNILMCYSIRNTSVGYCQGMNFIGGRILLIIGNEEQAFWLFIQIMENILPIIYYLIILFKNFYLLNVHHSRN